MFIKKLGWRINPTFWFSLKKNARLKQRLIIKYKFVKKNSWFLFCFLIIVKWKIKLSKSRTIFSVFIHLVILKLTSPLLIYHYINILLYLKIILLRNWVRTFIGNLIGKPCKNKTLTFKWVNDLKQLQSFI